MRAPVQKNVRNPIPNDFMLLWYLKSGRLSRILKKGICNRPTSKWTMGNRIRPVADYEGLCVVNWTEDKGFSCVVLSINILFIRIFRFFHVIRKTKYDISIDMKSQVGFKKVWWYIFYFLYFNKINCSSKTKFKKLLKLLTTQIIQKKMLLKLQWRFTIS